MTATTTIPSLAEVIEHLDRPGPIKQKCLTTCRQLFGDSIAPILLLQEGDLALISKKVGRAEALHLPHGLGAQLRMVLQQYYGLELRPTGLTITEYAIEVYGSAREVPVQALCIYGYFENVLVEYAPSPVIDAINMAAVPMTLGELSDMGPTQLYDLLTEKGVPFTDNGLYQECCGVIRGQLMAYGLPFAE